MLMIEPTEKALQITEVFQLSNAGKTTLLDPTKGSIQFYLRTARRKRPSTSEAPGGMPIQRPPEKTTQAGVFKASYPVKPGDDTTYEVTYALPPAQKLAGKVFGDDAVTMVTGPSVTLSGDKLESRGQDPQLHAHIYQFPSSTAGAAFEVSIEGTGAIRTDAADSGAGGQKEDTGQPEAMAGPARVYDRLYWVLGLTFGLLAVGGTLLYRRGRQQARVRAGSRSRRCLEILWRLPRSAGRKVQRCGRLHHGAAGPERRRENPAVANPGGIVEAVAWLRQDS